MMGDEIILTYSSWFLKPRHLHSPPPPSSVWLDLFQTWAVSVETRQFPQIEWPPFWPWPESWCRWRTTPHQWLDCPSVKPVSNDTKMYSQGTVARTLGRNAEPLTWHILLSLRWHITFSNKSVKQSYPCNVSLGHNMKIGSRHDRSEKGFGRPDPSTPV